MHFVFVLFLLGGGSWLLRHAPSPGYRLLALLSIGFGTLAAFGLAVFYRAIYRDQKK